MLERLRKSMGHLMVLGDELRQNLYLFVRDEAEAVTREAVADHFGISRNLAAFHLDKLVDRGLLVARYRREPGKGGPGAGRPPKVYEVSDIELDLTIPQRRYDFIGQILLEAVEAQTESEVARETARRIASEKGAAYANKVVDDPPSTAQKAATRTCRLLQPCGYEPYVVGDDVLLRNCPFHRLARRSPELICGLNQAFLDGFVRALNDPPLLSAVLDPQDGQCCVRLGPTTKSKNRRTPQNSGW